jgi:amino acid adenylation domain-containing protein
MSTTTDTKAATFEAVDYDPFADAGNEVARVVPTTEPQREVWLAHRLSREASLAYNESVLLRFSGALDTDALRNALSDLVNRHEALRATVSIDGAELTIPNAAVVNVPLVELSHLSHDEQSAAILDAQRVVVETPFDLERGPLFNAQILRFSATEHALIMTAHHIVCDGWSFGILVHDLAALYQARLGKTGAVQVAAASFGDYALAQRIASGGEQELADEAYWLSRFSGAAGETPVLDLPTDQSRAAWRTFASKREDLVIDADLLAGARKAGSRRGASLFATLLASFAALLHRISGANDVVIGVPSAGQSSDGLDTLVGHCVNLMPVRIAVEAATPISALVASAQTAMLDASEHQGYTFGTLLKKLALPRDPSRLPLVSVMFNLDQALDANTVGFTNLNVDFSSVPRSFENFELFINAVQVNGGLKLECQYNSDLFTEKTIQRWLAAYESLLRALAQSADTEVGRLPIVSTHDLALINQWNNTAQSFSRDACVHELFQRHAQLTPARAALRWADQRLAYGELNERANRIARCLRDLGVGSGSLVGLHVDRGPDMVASMLGILKAGAAYVPLDPAYPHDRLKYMVENAKLAALVTHASIANSLAFPRAQTLSLDEDASLLMAQSAADIPSDAKSAKPQDSAYVIYTSGSTGKPKGVLVPHRAVVNFLETMAREPGMNANDRIVAVTTLSFDIAVNELFLPLSVGAEIILASREQAGDGALLSNLIKTSEATTMQATPATWRVLIDTGWRAPVATYNFKALCGGEALTNELAKKLLDANVVLWNMYGPTETTVWSTCTQVADAKAAITIGHPIANTSVWVLDEQRRPCPIGVPGEIWIGGDGVTLGYLNNPSLTAERFIANPFSSVAGGKLYRTGDRGRWREGGNIEHMGRLDFQVKVRGYRIELGEIEACLATAPNVARAVAIAREDTPGDVRLVAYIVSAPNVKTDDDALRAHLKLSLPEYMIPQHFVTLPQIPLLSNGKVDRNSLPKPDASARAASEYVAPRTELEKAVAAEMEATLSLPGVSVYDDFFALGGHSLLAAQLTSRLNRVFDSRLSMRTLFESPTVERLANAIQADKAAPLLPAMAIERLTDQSVAPMSLMQERLWFLEELYPNRVTYNAPSAHRLMGRINENAFDQAFNEMIRRQPALRTCFERHGNTVVQRISDGVTCSLFPAEDLSHLATDERESHLRERLDELTAETFNLTAAPLFKAHMFKLGEVEHVLFFMAHHIIWDGWSFDLLYDEISALYGAFAHGRASPLNALPLSYGDFAAWHRKWVNGPEYAQQLAFWRGRLDQLSKFQELPTDMPRRPGMSGGGSTEWMTIAKPKIDALHVVAQQAGATLSMTMLTIYSVLLYGYARQMSLVIGMPVRGRNMPELEPIMGYFNNLLPFQIDIQPNEKFADLLTRVKSRVVESFACPDVPLEQLSKEISASSGRAASLLYQALFSFQDARQRVTEWGGLKHSSIPLFQHGATEDLGVWFMETADGVQGGVTYNTDIITEATAKTLRERYLTLLDAIIADPAKTIDVLVASHVAASRQNVTPVEAKPTASQAAAKPRPTSAPSTETEKLLAAIWCSELKLSDVSTADNFFDLGGHSLLAMQTMATMEEKTGKRVDPQKFIFETLGQIARAYDEAEAGVSANAGVAQKPERAAGSGMLGRLFGGLRGGKKG